MVLKKVGRDAVKIVSSFASRLIKLRCPQQIDAGRRECEDWADEARPDSVWPDREHGNPAARGLAFIRCAMGMSAMFR